MQGWGISPQDIFINSTRVVISCPPEPVVAGIGGTGGDPGQPLTDPYGLPVGMGMLFLFLLILLILLCVWRRRKRNTSLESSIPAKPIDIASSADSEHRSPDSGGSELALTVLPSPLSDHAHSSGVELGSADKGPTSFDAPTANGFDGATAAAAYLSGAVSAVPSPPSVKFDVLDASSAPNVRGSYGTRLRASSKVVPSTSVAALEMSADISLPSAAADISINPSSETARSAPQTRSPMPTEALLDNGSALADNCLALPRQATARLTSSSSPRVHQISVMRAASRSDMRSRSILRQTLTPHSVVMGSVGPPNVIVDDVGSPVLDDGLGQGNVPLESFASSPSIKSPPSIKSCSSNASHVASPIDDALPSHVPVNTPRMRLTYVAEDGELQKPCGSLHHRVLERVCQARRRVSRCIAQSASNQQS